MPGCDLCGLPLPATPATSPRVEGEFCCRGCLGVASRLGTDGDDVNEPRPAGGRGDHLSGTGEEAFLAVDGMHCASCEAFVEVTATDRPGVLGADANYPTGLVRLTYDPEAVAREDLPSSIDRLGYTAREVRDDPPADDSTGRLLVGGFFAMMVMVWYALFLYPTYLGVPPDRLLLDVSGPAGTYLAWNILVMASVVLLYTGAPILRGAYVSLRAGRPNMDLLVALAAVTAYLVSAIAVVTGRAEVYFDVAVMIVLVVSLGRRYEDRLRRRAVGHLAEMTEQRVDHARRVGADGVDRVAVADLEPGDRVVVRSGETIPVDGNVVDGSAAVDEGLLTGESRPRRATPGDDVIGGGVVRDGGVTVAVGDEVESTVDRLVRALWAAQTGRRGVQHLADRLAAVFVPAVVALAVVAAGWALAGGGTLTTGALLGLTVLVVSCPCALGLATPLAVASGVRAALAEGIVVTDATAVERAPTTDVVVFDKTGTLTTGRMTLESWTGDKAVLRRASAVERYSDHPVAAAITDARPPPEAAVEAVTTHPGLGITGVVAGDRVVVGASALMEREGVSVPDRFADRYTRAARDGLAPAMVSWDGAVRGVIVAADEPRAGWDTVIDRFAAEGRRVVVLTGDEGPVLDPFREYPGIDAVYAGVPPEGKAAVVERLREYGRVAMVGDGSNDAPALAAADLGIVLERGTRLAADAADAVVTTGELRTVPRVFELMAATRRRVRGNLAWAFVYNAVAIPVAAAGALNPLLAAGAMAASSLLVVGNSARAFAAPADVPGSVDGAEAPVGVAPRDPNNLNG